MDALLVGLHLRSLANRGLEVLGRAALTAGFEARIVPFAGFPDVERVARRVAAEAPRVCAISLSTIEAALATVVLVRRLRAHGYRGLVVLGGHFATLNAEALLRENEGIDLVVRLAGEEALTALLALGPSDRSAIDDEALAVISGVVFRDAGGAIRTGAPARPPRVRPIDDASIDVHLGLPTADVVLSHGCASHCGYCCIAAAGDLAVREARRGGENDPGAARYTPSTAESLARTLIALHRDRGVRVFQLMDDNVLPGEPAAVSAFARAVTRELEAASVPPLALTLQVRADAIDEESAAQLAGMGVVRAYVGIDGYSASQLRVLGRSAPAEAGPRAVALLREHDVLSVVNALLVGPTVPVASLRAELEALRHLSGAPVHLLPHEVRAGTPLFERARKRGLVEGSYLQFHYRFADPMTARVARLLTSLPTRLAERSVPIALYDLAFDIGVARRALAGVTPEQRGEASAVAACVRDALWTFDEVTAAWNLSQLAVIEQAIEAASASDAAIDAWLAANRAGIGSQDRAWRGACDEASRRIAVAVSQLWRRPVTSPQRGRTLGAVAFAMSVAACSSPPIEDASVSDAGSDTADAEGTDAALADTPGCNPLIDIQDTLEGCPSGEYALTFDGDGRVVDVALLADGGMLTTEMREAILSSFEGACYPSMAGTTQSFSGHCWLA